MRIVYIAGPYTPWPEHANRFCAREAFINQSRLAASWCAQHTLGYFSPHLNSAHMDVIVPEVDYEYWLSMDIHIITKCCDAMIMLSNWQRSNGACREYDYARTLRLPIFEFPHEKEEIIKWRDGLPYLNEHVM